MALLPNLISHWKLDESSGTAVDAHGAYDLTAVNTPGTRAGKIETARDFIRTSSERFELASNSDFQVTDEDFSFSCWFLRDVNSQFQTICSKSNAGQTIGFACWFNTSNVLNFSILGTTGTNTATVSGLTTATWYHLVCTHDVSAKVIRIYIDGGTPAEVTYTGSGSDDTSTFRIGSFETSSHFDGAIDEFSFWKGRELTSTDVAELYNSGSGIAYESYTEPPTPPTTALGITGYAPTVTGDPTLFEYFPDYSVAASAPTSASTMAVVSTPAIGANIALLLMAFDNSGTGADGDYSQITGVTDTKGNSWHKLAEHSNTNGGVGNGATVSAWYCEVDPNDFSSTTTTATLSSSTAGRCIAIIYFRSETLSLYAAEVLTAATDASSSYGSLTTTTPDKNRIYLRVCAQESDTASGFTPTTGFTTIVSNVFAGSGANMGLRAEMRIATQGAQTSNPSSSFSSDTASVFIALEADAAGGTGYTTAINTYSMTSDTATNDKVTQVAPHSIGANDDTADEVTQITPVSIAANDDTADEVTQIVIYSITNPTWVVAMPTTTALGITGYAPTVTEGLIGSVTVPTTEIGWTSFSPSAETPTTATPDVAVLGITGYAPTVTEGLVGNVTVPTTNIGIDTHVPQVSTQLGGDCCCCCWDMTVTVSVRFSARNSVR